MGDATGEGTDALDALISQKLGLELTLLGDVGVDVEDRNGTPLLVPQEIAAGHDGDQAALVLVECTVPADCTARAPRSFSLIFKADARAPVEQATYPISADGLGPQPVFLVPVAQRPDDAQFPLEYQAIFNHAPAPRTSP